MSSEAQLAYDLLQKPLPAFEEWYRKRWCINLTDAKDGYAILTIDNGHLALQSYSCGISY